LNQDQIIARLQEFVFDPQLATDQGYDEGWVNPSTGEPTVFIADPPASLESLERIETELGFRLPELLQRIYLEVGDGGFGPGYGLLGLLQSKQSCGSLLQETQRVRSRSPTANTKYIALAYWGCSVFSYLKLEAPHAVYIMDWDGQNDDDPLEEYLHLQADSFEDFFVKWFAGEDLFSVAFEESGLQ
jgi:hypothetical protein